MRDTDPISRRNVLKITGAVGVTTFIAGCNEGGNGNGNGDDQAEENDEEPADGNGDEETNGNGNGEVIEPDTRIEFDAQTDGWVGVEPEEIADEDNPTLTLQDGESYEIGWEEGDGSQHNIELVDENDEVVEDYETEESEEGGDDQFIEFDATDEIIEYVCRPHEGTMRGTIEIETNGEGDENGADEEEENGATEDEENGDTEEDQEQ